VLVFVLIGDALKMLRQAPKGSGFGMPQLLGIAFILVAAFYLLQRSGWLSRIPAIGPSVKYSVLFLMGLLTSPHCVCMSGGINFSQSVRTESAEDGSIVTHPGPDTGMPVGMIA
jgi:hypothetical protein